MEIKLLRSDGQGIAGTYANIDHHAQPLKPLVKALEKEAKRNWKSFKTWRQGHNIHIFETWGGAKYELVPTTDNGEYVGVCLRLHVSRSVRIPLVEITTVEEIPSLSETMRLLSLGVGNEIGGGIRKCAQAA